MRASHLGVREAQSTRMVERRRMVGISLDRPCIVEGSARKKTNEDSEHSPLYAVGLLGA